MLNRFHFHDGAEHLINGQRHAATILHLRVLILISLYWWYLDVDEACTDNSIEMLLNNPKNSLSLILISYYLTIIRFGLIKGR